SVPASHPLVGQAIGHRVPSSRDRSSLRAASVTAIKGVLCGIAVSLRGFRRGRHASGAWPTEVRLPDRPVIVPITGNQRAFAGRKAVHLNELSRTTPSTWFP